MPSRKHTRKVKETVPFSFDDFIPMPLPNELRDNDNVKAMQEFLSSGTLLKWEIGSCDGHISSRILTDAGEVDTLAAPDLADKNFERLIWAHACRVIRMTENEN